MMHIEILISLNEIEKKEQMENGLPSNLKQEKSATENLRIRKSSANERNDEYI